MKSASPDVRLYFGQGSPLTDITDLVTNDINLNDVGIKVDTTPYGATAVRKTILDIADIPDVALDMLFDNAPAGTEALFATRSDENTPDYTFMRTVGSGSPITIQTWLCAISETAIVTKVKDVTRRHVVLSSRGPIVTI
jgi:hypothetical protein